MPVTALFLIPRRINFGPFDWKYKLFYIRIGGLALLLLLQFVGRLNRNKSSKGRASRNMFTGLVLTVVNRAAFNDKRKTRRKENVSSTLPRNKTKKPMTNGTKSNYTSHCRIAAKNKLVVFPPVPRMLATVFGWGQVIRATFSHNLSRNIVALQVEKRCCPYYHLRSQLVTQQISMLQVVAN